MDEWIYTRVDERMKAGLGDRRPDMLQYFIEAKTSNGKPMSRDEVMMELLNIVGAGADTTAIAISVVLGQLILHPDSFQRVRDEVDELHRHLNPDELLRFQALEKLSYLSAVIRESTRLHPSITYQLPRVPPPEGVQIGEYHIPSSVACGISPAAMNRSRSLFGDDAEDWVPERWLPNDDSAEEVKRLRTMEQNLTTVSQNFRSPIFSCCSQC